MNEAKDILLNDIEQSRFIVLYLVSCLGVLMLFLSNLYRAINIETDTPMHFSIKHFLKGFIRVVLTLVGLFFGITNWDTISIMIFNTDTVPGLTAFSAFLLGLGSERLVKGLFSGGAESFKTIKKK